MEITCNRCHQTVLSENCYCPACGLPQLQYSTDGSTELTGSEQHSETVQDASTVNWKPALRVALLLALPTGLLASAASPLGSLGLVWMTLAAAWTVVLYVRSQRPAWITIGAGARIGLVTGLLAGWLAVGFSGGYLFFQRFVLHQSSQIDTEWKTRVDMGQQMAEQLTAGMSPADASQAQAARAQFQAWMLSPEGHAGMETFRFIIGAAFLLFFAAAGGALGARWMIRARKPEV